MKKCPMCNGSSFYLVVEITYSSKVKDIRDGKVIPFPCEDTLTGKSLVCDDCGFNGWIDEYKHYKNGEEECC